MLKRTLSLACTLVLLLSMCGCSRQLSETPNAPAETSALEEVTPTPEPARRDERYLFCQNPGGRGENPGAGL